MGCWSWWWLFLQGWIVIKGIGNLKNMLLTKVISKPSLKTTPSHDRSKWTATPEHTAPSASNSSKRMKKSSSLTAMTTTGFMFNVCYWMLKIKMLITSVIYAVGTIIKYFMSLKRWQRVDIVSILNLFKQLVQQLFLKKLQLLWLMIFLMS